MKKVMFVSGHMDTTREEFCTHYVPKLREAVDRGCAFVVGDAFGTDAMTQVWLADENDFLYATEKPLLEVTVFHMLEKPRNFLSREFKLIGGFESTAGRGAGLPYVRSDDIAWVRPGHRRNSGTEQNLKRRQHKREVARKNEIRSWPQVNVSEYEAWPVYSVSVCDPQYRDDEIVALDKGDQPVILSDTPPRLPKELIERYEAASTAFFSIRDEIQRLLSEQDWGI